MDFRFPNAPGFPIFFVSVWWRSRADHNCEDKDEIKTFPWYPNNNNKCTSAGLGPQADAEWNQNDKNLTMENWACEINYGCQVVRGLPLAHSGIRVSVGSGVSCGLR